MRILRDSAMLSFVRSPYLHHHGHFSPFLAATNPLRSHFSDAEFIGTAFPNKRSFSRTIRCFSTNSSPNNNINLHKVHRQDTRYVNMEPERTNSVSAAVGGGSGAEDYVHVDDKGDEVSSASGGKELGVSEKRELPEDLATSVLKLTCESTVEGGTCDVYLVGTAHVSTESCEQVKAVIGFLKPQAVFLELCASRVTVLHPQNLKIPTVSDMLEMWKRNDNLFGIFYGWFLAKVASKLEVFPGAEFRVAYEEAMMYGGRVILGDRPVQITLRRTWAIMPLWHKIKLLSNLLFQAVSLPSTEDLTKMLKDMDDVDMLTLVIQEMSKQFPTLMETLVHERDKFMSSSLRSVAREHSSVVAVVGKGHLPGIKKYWEQHIEVKELLTTPTRRPTFSGAKCLVPTGILVAGVAAIAYGIYLSSKK